MYCARWIPAHARCFLPCICLRQISHIQICLYVVVRPGFVSTSPAFMRSRDSHKTGPHGQLSKKKVKRAPIDVGKVF